MSPAGIGVILSIPSSKPPKIRLAIFDGLTIKVKAVLRSGFFLCESRQPCFLASALFPHDMDLAGNAFPQGVGGIDKTGGDNSDDGDGDENILDDGLNHFTLLGKGLNSPFYRKNFSAS